MLISEAFDLYKTDYMAFKRQSIRIIESHDFVKRTLIQIIGDKNIAQLSLSEVKEWEKDMAKTRTQIPYAGC